MLDLSRLSLQNPGVVIGKGKKREMIVGWCISDVNRDLQRNERLYGRLSSGHGCRRYSRLVMKWPHWRKDLISVKIRRADQARSL